NEIMYAEKDAGARIRTPDKDRPLAVSADSNTIWIDGRTKQAASAVRQALILRRWYVWLFSSTLTPISQTAGSPASCTTGGLQQTMTVQSTLQRAASSPARPVESSRTWTQAAHGASRHAHLRSRRTSSSAKNYKRWSWSLRTSC